MRVIAKPAYKNRTKNPYNWLLYHHLEHLGADIHDCSLLRCLFERYDILHVHWPEDGLNAREYSQVFYRLLSLFLIVKLAKCKGAKLVWTSHNYRAHERHYPRLEKCFWQTFLNQIDGYISLSHQGREILLHSFPQLQQKPCLVSSHGHYQDAYPNDVDRQTARDRFSILPDQFVIAHFGRIRQYKNVPHLIETFRQLPDPKLVLLIAGAPETKEIQHCILEGATNDPRVQVNLETLREEEFQYYLQAADLVILPYFEVLNSGSALLSLSFGCPTLLPNKGSMRELQEQVGKQWIKLYEDELTVSVLKDAISWASINRFDSIDLSHFDWDEIAQETFDFFKLLDRDPV
ncbi:glycosyltransferase family 4 protein [Leptolyngbya boryana CZ1]|uniref:Glycosyltransferase family 4 protein n=1 Tax=Leptolyngbya boryana CZ1 TaxID=3060204 RepID=A0AA96X0L8_LEPBY|nr:glycosyltransferase family 4 protein [Leptolyngbya boryana]WNZ47629.1 glycosyltransferase family 4 protein [Leptolyngbya boryana CZ1]